MTGVQTCALPIYFVAKFIFSDNYNTNLERIEDYILESSESIDRVSEFLDEHDKILRFIEQNPTTASAHPTTGDQSWVFGEGRYRIFFKCADSTAGMVINLIHIIDNKELNQSVYPGNKIPTYDED